MRGKLMYTNLGREKKMLDPSSADLMRCSTPCAASVRNFFVFGA